MLEKIKNILTKDFFQRVIYGLGFLLWTVLMWSSLMKYPFATSSLKISYLTLYLIPAIILIIQIVRNNKLLWVLIFGLFSSFILISLITGVIDWIERSGNHVKAVNWTLEDIIFIILYFGVLSGIDWIIYYIKPKKLI